MIKKFSLFSLLITAVFILAFSGSALAEQNNGYVPPPIDLSYLEDNPPKENSSNGIENLKATTIPSAYDLRNVSGKSYVTKAKDQSEYGACWAFASIGAMESNYLIKYGKTLDLSEMHLAWYTFKNSDASKAFLNLTSTSDVNTILNPGGHAFYATALYSRLDGPVLDTSLPYTSTAPKVADPDSYARVLRLRDVYYLSFTASNVNNSSENRQNVKRRIMESGAVLASYSNTDSGFKEVSSSEISYYTTQKDTNHAILIVGWDDNYSKSNFKTKPASNGAWLIKNSWGTDWGDSGYFWMSYEQYLKGGTAFIVEDADDDMQAYYYDALGWTGNTSLAYGANVFKSQRAGERLTEVAFYTTDNNIDYKIDIYTGMTSMPANSPINGSPVQSVTGTQAFAGYHTVTLDDPIDLTEGEYFSVVVSFPGTSKYPIEMKSSNFADNVTIETGSFTSPNGSIWSAKKDCNVCIKAFTQTASNIAPKITSTSISDAFLDAQYSCKISASGSRPLTWSYSGTLPDGLTFDSSTGVISGTPSKTGDFEITVTAENSSGTDSKTFTLSVTDIPEITTSEIDGYVGYALSERIKLSNEQATASWSIASGSLPKGLSLSSSTGTISGTPKTKGTSSVTFKASSSTWEISKKINIVIEAKPTKPTISTSKLTDGKIGKEYSASIKTKGTTPVTLSISDLPAGLSMTSDGQISGTPTVAGNFIMTVTASNVYTELNGTTVTKNVKLKIAAEVPEIEEPTDLPMAIVGQEYEGYNFAVSEGTEPITWTASSLPKGLTLSTEGKLEGTPTKAGNFKITLKAQNFSGKDSIKVPITVYQIPEITTTKLNDATTDKKYTVRVAATGTAPISWDIEGLPDTLTITANDKGDKLTITGTPTEANVYDLTIIASNAAGESEETNLTLTVKGVAPKIKGSLTKAAVNKSYSGSISATGTKPISFSYEIKDSDKTKYGVNTLEEIGLSLTVNANEGTAAIAGTPTQSIKSLPIYIKASNITGDATKKLTFTAKGTKPSFTSDTADSLTQALNSSVSIPISVEGSKKITISMNKVSGFSLNQDSDYSATISGTAPSKTGKIKIKVTASNADGKTSKTIVVNASDILTNDEAKVAETLNDSESLEDSSETEPEVQYVVSNSEGVTFSTERRVKSYGSKELDALEGYTVAATFPELTVSESNMYDFEVDLEPGIESDKKLYWFAFPKNREKNSDDEIVEFFDIEGNEITKTTDEYKIIASVWLNAGDIYEPVIAVKDSEDIDIEEEESE